MNRGHQSVQGGLASLVACLPNPAKDLQRRYDRFPELLNNAGSADSPLLSLSGTIHMNYRNFLNREKFAQMRIWTAWRTSLRARLPESGWRPKPARVATPFEISPPMPQERTWHQIAE